MVLEKKYVILKVGLNFLKEYGPGFSLDDLCSRLAISKKTFYQYFINKNQLLQLIIQDLVGGWGKVCLTQNESSPDPHSFIVETVRFHLDELCQFNANFLRNLEVKYPSEHRILADYFRQVREAMGQCLRNYLMKENKAFRFNIEMFLEKESMYFNYILLQPDIARRKENYLLLLSLSLKGILA